MTISNLNSTTSAIFPEVTLYQRKIAVWDKDEIFLRKFHRHLVAAGFQHVETVSQLNIESGETSIEQMDLIVLDVSMFEDTADCFSFTEFTRCMGYSGRIVIISEESTFSQISEAARSGVNDFWIKGKALNIIDEVESTLMKGGGNTIDDSDASNPLQTGLFRTVGLTTKEIDLLQALASGFPHRRELAQRLGMTEKYVNRMFAGIYKKLGKRLGVDNPFKLAHLLTVCVLFSDAESLLSPLRDNNMAEEIQDLDILLPKDILN